MSFELDDIEVEEGRGLVPNNMIDGFVAIGDVFDVTWADRGNGGFVTDHLDPEGRMGEKDDDRVGGMDMSKGRVARRDLSFQQPIVRVFLDDLVMGFPADGELGVEASRKEEGS